MTKKTKGAMLDLQMVKQELNSGNISYDEAKIQAQPSIDILNEEAKKVAKKYGKKHHNFNFTGLMR